MLKKILAITLIIFAAAGCKSNAGVNSCGKGCSSDWSSVNKVYFGFDSAKLECACKDNLNKQIKVIKSKPCKEVMVSGHTDPRGTKEYNMGLGHKRAQAVKAYLKEHGVDSKIKVVSFGKEKAKGHDEASWAADRKTVTELK